MTRTPLSTLGAMLVALHVFGAGCATFANVHSAVIDPGSSGQVQLATTGHPGYVAGTIWGGLCDGICSSERILGLDAGYSYGWPHHDGTPPVSLGVGIASLVPYVDGYVQLSESRRLPFGVGARVGTLGAGWIQEHVYGRVDVPLANDVRLLWNPGLFHADMSSDNDWSGGNATYTGITQGVGLQLGAGSVVFTPSVAAVWGRAKRTILNQQLGPQTRLFGTLGLAIAFRHDPRSQ